MSFTSAQTRVTVQDLGAWFLEFPLWGVRSDVVTGPCNTGHQMTARKMICFQMFSLQNSFQFGRVSQFLSALLVLQCCSRKIGDEIAVGG